MRHQGPAQFENHAKQPASGQRSLLALLWYDAGPSHFLRDSALQGMRGPQLTVGDEGSFRRNPPPLKPFNYLVGVGVSGKSIDVTNLGAIGTSWPWIRMV